LRARAVVDRGSGASTALRSSPRTPDRRSRHRAQGRAGTVGPLPTLPLSDVVATLRTAGCVFADDEARLLVDAARSPAELTALVERRVNGEPLEHLLGWAEFCGLRIVVAPGVFVPRRRTELLVRLAAPLLRPGDVVVELCCGAAAVATALAAAVPGLALHAVDVDPAAVACARRNLAAGQVYEGDLDVPLPAELRGRVAVVVANAPYVPTGEIALMPPEARDHEPRVALDGGVDGLDIQRRVAAVAPSWLVRGGSLLIETSERQAAPTADAVSAAGLVARVERSEELDATAVVGTQP
jgi:release factor glutamine methyltransferase